MPSWWFIVFTDLRSNSILEGRKKFLVPREVEPKNFYFVVTVLYLLVTLCNYFLLKQH